MVLSTLMSLTSIRMSNAAITHPDVPFAIKARR
jgi:hypothetical protein